METLKDKAIAMLDRCEVVVLTSVNKEGYPRPVPMSKVKSEDLSAVWMATGFDSVKTRDFLANPKSGLCFQEGGNSVALTGDVEVVTDNEVKKALWQEWFINHFPGGATDPNYVLIKFLPRQATFWIEGKFVHRTLK